MRLSELINRATVMLDDAGEDLEVFVYVHKAKDHFPITSITTNVDAPPDAVAWIELDEKW